MKDDDPEFDEEEFDEEEIGPFGTNGDNLEGLARHALSRLNNERSEEIDVTDYPELEELVMELNDSTSAYYSDFTKKLSFQPSVINKFLKLRGKVRTNIARKLADRLVTYIRTNEQSAERSAVPLAQPPSTPAPTEAQPELVISATEWKLVKKSDEVEEKITELVRLLTDVSRNIVTSNLPDNQRALTEIERAQLIAVLETVLKMLKAPMIEKGLVKKAGDMLKRAAAKAVEKQVEETFAFAAGFAAGKLSHLVGIL